MNMKMWKYPVPDPIPNWRLATLVLATLAIFSHSSFAAHDIVIYGSSPAAISAAVQAKRMGRSAVIVSPETRIGGLTTGGLGQTDIGNKSAFGGIALEFYRDVAKWYADPAHWTRQTSQEYKPEGQTAGTKGKDSMWTFEPSAALAILEGWEKRDGLDIRRNEWLDRAKGVEKRGGRIVSIKTLSGNVYRGKVFIDATYEGDLMAAAGVSYTVGREANSVYGETISGIEFREARSHQLKWYVSPYVVEGKPESGLLPGIEPRNPDEKDGDGDKRVQAYNFRMCLTYDPENRIPFKKPANYDEMEYELPFRNFAKGEKAIPWINSKMPNRKTDTNNRLGFSTDFIGRNYEWPEASYERRAEIFKAHLEYQQGLMWTLANHQRVPEHVRAEVSKWGTCKDEFSDGPGDGWQSQLYVREARRMVGEYVMTEHECRGDRKVPRPVAMGAYTMDSHNVRRVVTAKGNTKNEGDVQDSRRYSAWGPDADKRAKGGWMKPYGIDYGAITPKRGECENLLVPVCLSASHMAFGSIRMEPVFFALGQAAGTAASLAVAGGTRSCASAVQDVPYGKLAARLVADGQVIPSQSITENVPPVATAECQGNSIRLYSAPLSYEVAKDGKVVVPRTEIGLCVDGKELGRGAKVSKPVRLKNETSRTSRTWREDVFGGALSSVVETPVYKKAWIDVSREERTVDFGGDFAVRLVARPDGVAYRFELKKGGDVADEKADLTIPKNARCWFNRTSRKALEGVIPQFADATALRNADGKLFFLPFVYSVEGKTVAVMDTDVHDYPVWNFGDVEQTEAGAKLKSFFAKYPKSTELSEGGKRGRFIHVRSSEEYIAKATAPRTLPWRVFALVDSPSKLCESDISYALATPNSPTYNSPTHNFSWVKPGKVAWDWWNAFDNKGDPNGCTTKTYVRFIDFAAANGVEYVIFDEGWSANLDIWKSSPKVDVPYLIDYANKKGVGIILWMAWAQAYGDEERVVEHFAKLGAKGFKVDFMDRGDADVQSFLEKFAAVCAKHRMVVDYHGSCRPAGLHRTYPNILNFEAIHGLEQMKWAKKDKDMCHNDVAVFFLRMTDGPMDYTPGAMDNYLIGDYRGNGRNPGSVGTRAHQMALMALYEAPLQMLADSPTKYEKNMECFSFMAKTPVVWDAIVGLGGCPESYAAVARKAKDGAWYAAAISNREARDIEIGTSFLGEGEWKAEIFRDADDADKQPTHYVHEFKRVKAGERMTFHAAPGGGFVISFKAVK